MTSKLPGDGNSRFLDLNISISGFLRRSPRKALKLMQLQDGNKANDHFLVTFIALYKLSYRSSVNDAFSIVLLLTVRRLPA